MPPKRRSPASCWLLPWVTPEDRGDMCLRNVGRYLPYADFLLGLPLKIEATCASETSVAACFMLVSSLGYS
jgi:hypothetical protein